MRRSFFFPALFLAIAASAQAQPCGPLTFSFSGTGAGCDSFGGVPPVLTGALVPSPVPSACTVRFTLASSSAIPYPFLAFLVIGATNPMLDLAPYGLPGCTLLAYPVVVVPMSPGTTYTTHRVTITVSPSLLPVPVTSFQQTFTSGSPGPFIVPPTLSNGVRMDIS